MIWHSSKTNEVLQQLTVTKENGLANSVALERLETYGKNTISTSDKKGLFSLFAAQLKSKVIYFLVAVALISVAVDIIYKQNDFYFSFLIIAIVLLNAFISAFHLHKCDQALDDIQNAANPNVVVIRDGIKKVIPSEFLVPGDIMLLNEGDYITVDARIIESDALRCNEAVLSGDIIPVEKSGDAVFEDITEVIARKNMVFAGTSVIHGSATVVVVETGLSTEIGKQADIKRQTNSQKLPITETLESSGNLINFVILILCVITFFIGLIQNFHSSHFATVTIDAIMNAVALGISTMPKSFVFPPIT